MHKLINNVTDKIATRKGVWITIIVWVALAAVLSVLAPGSKSDAVSTVTDLYPASSQSVVADEKLDAYFKEDDGIPALLVFEAKTGDVALGELVALADEMTAAEIPYVKSIPPLGLMPEVATDSFFSEDRSKAFLPVLFDAELTSKEMKEGLAVITSLVEGHANVVMHVTGPVGIAVDTTDLFSRADLVLLFSTVGIILLLLIVTYRSPLLALIPLLAAGFVYAVVDRILGIMGASGVELAKQSLSIMMILLFAVVIDYSLFIFSRYQEELKKRADKYEAMRFAMREIGIPIFYSGSTIFLAMMTLLLAQFGDYNNFAPIFSVAVLVVLLAAVTLVPALFTAFGRRAFWPKVPRVGDEQALTSSFWGRIGKLVAAKPIISVVVILAFLVVTGSQVFTISNEYDTMKSFPDDMPSRVGYDILEADFSKGTLAPTTVIFESEAAITADETAKLSAILAEKDLVSTARLANQTDDGLVAQFDVTFSENPYEAVTMDALEQMINDAEGILQEAGLAGDLHFAGETAASVDNRSVNKRDIIVIVIVETVLIFAMLIFLTRSFRLSFLMIATILLSFVAALGLGYFLSGYLFGIDALNNRVPVYAFVFLVALGIDYNIFLVSRYMEEKKHHPVREAVRIAIGKTGGVISSAGVILAATFAVLMTQPVEVLKIFGFIVAIGILIDTFLIRGILLPGLLILIEERREKKNS